MKIETEIQQDAETRLLYSFTAFDGFNIVFTSYHKEVKPKGKRKWQITEFWDRYAHPQNRHRMADEPTLTNEVKAKTLQTVKDLIKVKTWDEWKY